MGNFGCLSIKKRIIFTIALTSLVASLIVALFSLDASVSTMKKQANDSITSATTMYANSFESNFREVENISNLLEYEVRNNVDVAQTNNPEYLDKLTNSLVDFVKSQAVNSKYSKTAYIYFNPSLSNSIHDIYFADENDDGKVEMQNSIPIDFYSVTNPLTDVNAWWFVPSYSKQPYWSNPYIWQYNNGKKVSFISYTKPVIINNKLICVVGSDFLYSNMKNTISKIKFNNNGSAFLLDENYKLLISPNMKNSNNSGFITNSSLNLMITKIKNSSSNLIEFSSPNASSAYVSYKKLSNNWILAVVDNESDVLSSLNSYKNHMLILILIIFITFTIVSVRLGHIISSPIVEIAETLNSMPESSFKLNLPRKYTNSDDEIWVLSRAINAMSAKIEENFNEINMKNSVLQSEVNERKAAESTLDMTFDILSNSKVGVFIADRDFTLRYVNDSFSTITGFDRMSIINKKLTDEVILLNAKIVNELAEEDSWNGRLIQKKKNGQEYHQLLFINAIKSSKYYFMGIIKDITSDIQKDDNLEHLKNYDSLTNLENKNYFIQSVDNYIDGTSISNTISALLILNIEDFRLINEAISHNAGDLLLIRVAEKLKGVIDKNDIISRSSSDEFSIFIKSKNSMDEICEVLNKITGIFNSYYTINGEEIFVTADIGVCLYPEFGSTADELFRNAFAALNHSRLTKSGNYELYKNNMNKSTYEKYVLLKDLRHALENKNFKLYYQPQVDTKQNKIIGVEALIRWDSDNGLVPPDKFIPIAEDSKLIIPLGEWIINEACKTEEKLYRMGYNIKMAINISAVQFKYEDYLLSSINNALSKITFPNDLLDFEITEGIFLENAKKSSLFLSNIRDLGINLSIDDFGTGYSSLSYLRDFTVDRIKIDRSFIKDIPHKDTGIIAKTIIQLSHNLGVDVIAEGVETKEQLDFLAKLNCTEIQGYYFSKPITEEELFKLLKESNKSI